MGLAHLLVLPLLSALSPVEMEFEATRRVVEEFERTREPEPVGDPVLAEAARTLARRALKSSAAEAGDQLSISEALSDALGHDANPHAYVIAGSPPEEALRSLLSSEWLRLVGATHVGIGAAVDGERGAVAVLLPRRKASLRPFPRSLPRTGVAHALCGELLDGLEDAQVYVTLPSGRVDRIPLTLERGREFCATVSFAETGRHTVEVVGRGRWGPEVAALFFVDAAISARAAQRLVEREPTTVDDARRRILERINALRRANDLLEVSSDDDLTRIAQEYSDEMAATNFIAHVTRSGDDLDTRLRRGGFQYRAAGENLGLASGPLAAHFGIEHSPGHRFTLLEREFGRVGIGVTFQRVGDRTQAVVVEVLASAEQHTTVKYQEINAAAHHSVYPRVAKQETPVSELTAAAYSVIAARRAAQKLPPLQRSDVLDQIAQAQVRRALATETGRTQLPLHARVFAAENELGAPEVEFGVYDSLDGLRALTSLGSTAFDHVGLGVVRVESSASGRARYWVITLFARR